MIRYTWKYVTDHWRGQHSFAWSFWVNLVLLRVLIFATQELFNPEDGHDFSENRALILSLAAVFHGIVFVWQVVGVFRASGAHIRARGSIAPVWASQLGIIAAFLWDISYVFGAWQMTVPIPDLLKSQIEFEAERAAKYRIEPTGDGQSLMLTGTLELGITDHLRDQIEAYPDVGRIILASDGGNIYEARGLANVIRQNGLNTIVIAECSSACTTVFIGGANRHLVPGGKLGFHQYRLMPTMRFSMRIRCANKAAIARPFFNQGSLSGSWTRCSKAIHRKCGIQIYPSLLTRTLSRIPNPILVTIRARISVVWAWREA